MAPDFTWLADVAYPSVVYRRLGRPLTFGQGARDDRRRLRWVRAFRTERADDGPGTLVPCRPLRVSAISRVQVSSPLGTTTREDGQQDANERSLEKQRRRLRERARAAFVEGAEEFSRVNSGRPLTRDELQRVLKRYPGDP